MRIVTTGCPQEAQDMLAETLAVDETPKIVLARMDELNSANMDRLMTSGLMSPNAECVFMVHNSETMLAMCKALKEWGMFSTDIQLIIQRDIGMDYASSIALRYLSDAGLEGYVMAKKMAVD